MAEFKQGDLVRTKGYPSFDFVVTETDPNDSGQIGVTRFYVEPVGGSGFGGRIESQYMRIHPVCLELVPPKFGDCCFGTDKCPVEQCPTYAAENAGDDCVDGDKEMLDIVGLFGALADELKDHKLNDLVAELMEIEEKYHARNG